MAEKPTPENKADNAKIGQQADTPQNGVPAPSDATIEELTKQLAEKEEQNTALTDSVDALTKQLAEKDAEIERMRVQPASYQGPLVRSFAVVKEYCGVEIGEVRQSSDLGQIDHMVKQGYWKEK